MIIETTVYIHKNTLLMLNRGAEITGRTMTFLIKLLIQRVMRGNRKLLKSNTRVKYQERDEKENWRRLHISFNEDEYEYCLDMRKFFKMSVSLILAFAVMRYLDDIINELIDGSKNTDNYRFRNYMFINKIIDGIICWQIYWGYPKKYPILH